MTMRNQLSPEKRVLTVKLATPVRRGMPWTDAPSFPCLHRIMGCPLRGAVVNKIQLALDLGRGLDARTGHELADDVVQRGLVFRPARCRAGSDLAEHIAITASLDQWMIAGISVGIRFRSTQRNGRAVETRSQLGRSLC